MYAMKQMERAVLQDVLDRLEHTLMLAKRAASGEEPETGAIYLADTLDELAVSFRTLRAVRSAVERSERVSPPHAARG